MPRPRKVTPAAYVIGLFGGTALADALNVDTSTPFKWRERTGRVPADYQLAILALARKQGIELSAEDLIA